MKFRFMIYPDKCIGCRTCEVACAFAHSKNQKPGRTRIYAIGYGEEKWVPVACLQCDEAACVTSCMFGALRRNEETGAVEVDYERCVKCDACVAACPFGCALRDDVHDEIVKCDLCKGTPACAAFCPTKALEYKKVPE